MYCTGLKLNAMARQTEPLPVMGNQITYWAIRRRIFFELVREKIIFNIYNHKIAKFPPTGNS